MAFNKITLNIRETSLDGTLPRSVQVKVWPVAASETKALLPFVKDTTGNVVMPGHVSKRVTESTGLVQVVLPDPRDTSLNPTGFGYKVSIKSNLYDLETWFGPADITAHVTGGVLEWEDVVPAPTASWTATIPGGGASTWDELTDKPTFATVATSGAYTDLSGKPTIPSITGLATSAQVATDIATASTTDRDRANHTGTQTSATITDFTEAAQDAVAAMLASGANVTLSYNDAGDSLQVTASGTDAEVVRDTIGAAVAGINGVTVAVNDGADTITLSITGLTIAQTTGLQSALDTLTSGKADKATTPIDLPDTTVAGTSGQLAASVTSNVTANGAYTSPALDASVATPPKRWAVKADDARGCTVTLPDPAGVSTVVTLLPGEALTFRQKTTSGWGVESGNKTLAQLVTTAAPPHAGPRARTFDPILNVYGSATSRAAVRRALGFAVGAKSSLVNILISGDSYSAGWKANVVGGAGTSELQTVTITGAPTGGTFTLTFSGQTTAAIAFNAAPSAVQAALVALSNIGTGNVVVNGSTGGPYTVWFTGTLATTDVALMTATSSLTGGTTPAVGVVTTVGGVASAQGDDWATLLTNQIRAAGYPVTGGWVFAGSGFPSGTDGRWTFGSGWTRNDTTGNISYVSLAGTTATFTSSEAGTVLEFVIVDGSAHTVHYTVDGGPDQTFTSLAAAPKSVTITGLANTTHTVTITTPSSGIFYAVAARVRNTTGVSITNASIYGSHTNDWLPTAKGVNAWIAPYALTNTVLGTAPKLVLLCLGGNDAQHSGYTLTSFKANLSTIASAYQTAGSTVLQRTYVNFTTAGLAAAAAGSPLATGTTWNQFLSAMYDVSDTYDTTLVDHTNVLGDSNTLVAGGLMFSDNLHLLTPGQGAIARADVRAIQGV